MIASLVEREFDTLRPHDPHCVFCKIIHGEIPSARVLETAEAVAFLDINPVNPRPHAGRAQGPPRSVSELPDSVAADVGSLLPRLCRAIRAATGADGLNVIVNNGRAAGQTIDHCHWHIIPRFHDDPVNWPWPHSDYVGDELGQMTFRSSAS